MKKVGLLILALVLALGALGAGYAMWSDQILINGTVNTGTVDINVDNYSSTYVYKVKNTGGFEVSPTPILDPNYLEVASAVAGPSTDYADDAVTVVFDNLFPLFMNGAATTPAPFCVDFGGTYDGTIPVHFDMEWEVGCIKKDGATVTEPEILAAINSLMTTYADLNVWVDPAGPTAGEFLNYKSDLIQLHQGDTYNVELCIIIPQEITVGNKLVNSQEYLSGVSFCFNAKILAYQWNESAPTGAWPTNSVPEDLLVFTTGLAENNNPMVGTLAIGFTFVRTGTEEQHVLTLVAPQSDPALASGEYPFYLCAYGAQQTTLFNYFNNQSGNWDIPAWIEQMQDQISGSEPWFFLKYDGSYSLVDNWKQVVLGYDDAAAALTIPGDYPVGTYNFEGVLVGQGGVTDHVTVTLIVQ